MVRAQVCSDKSDSGEFDSGGAAGLAASPSLRALGGSAVAYRIERQVRHRHGLVELGKFRWDAPVDLEMRSDDEHVSFNLALSPRPVDGAIAHQDGAGRERPEKLGRVMVLAPGGRYRLTLAPGRVRALYCSIERRRIEPLLHGTPARIDPQWDGPPRERGPVIELLLNRIHDELCAEEVGWECTVDAYVQALSVEIARCLRSAPATRSTPCKGGLAPWRRRLLLDRIHAERPAPDLPELAELCGMTVRQLSRAFREETGRSLGAMVDEVTMERAARLLIDTDRPIAEIAACLGYASGGSFTQAFRRARGLQPRELRARAGL